MAKVKVPQTDGEIVVRYDGRDPVKYTVSGGNVNVDDADLPRFLAAVDGAEHTSGGTPAKDKE